MDIGTGIAIASVWTATAVIWICEKTTGAGALITLFTAASITAVIVLNTKG